ncbi:hypothetical protein BG015_005001 [Linnemannia schmuckeri]|uniref:Uncharacterized protein n=1 Tax=Linnemannia schmuckeri TaxID=64567 RepID=A0A9P5S1D0_9FUNG|nr:hypothetical protein BG015_005001 [Linnemannia schmuckeri]
MVFNYRKWSASTGPAPADPAPADPAPAPKKKQRMAARRRMRLHKGEQGDAKDGIQSGKHAGVLPMTQHEDQSVEASPSMHHANQQADQQDAGEQLDTAGQQGPSPAVADAPQ